MYIYIYGLLIVNFFIADENKLLLHSLNTIDYLIPLLEHEDKYVKRYAIMAYSVMVKNS